MIAVCAVWVLYVLDRRTGRREEVFAHPDKAVVDRFEDDLYGRLGWDQQTSIEPHCDYIHV